MSKITYKKVQDWVKRHYGFVPKTCWIAHCKELNGLPVRANRSGTERVVPCPHDKRDAIRDSFRHFGMIQKEIKNSQTTDI